MGRPRTDMNTLSCQEFGKQPAARRSDSAPDEEKKNLEEARLRGAIHHGATSKKPTYERPSSEEPTSIQPTSKEPTYEELTEREGYPVDDTTIRHLTPVNRIF